jgi:hypothetical protein
MKKLFYLQLLAITLFVTACYMSGVQYAIEVELI